MKQSDIIQKGIFEYESDKNEIIINNLNKNTKYEFRICCKYIDIIGKFSEIYEESTNNEEKINWKCGPNCIMTNGNRYAKKTGIGCSCDCTLIGDKALKKNSINKWKLKIIKTKYSDNTIGIAKKEIHLNEKINYEKGLAWPLYCKNGNIINKKWKKYTDCRVNINEEIEVICHTTQRTLSFKIKGNDYGIAFSDLPSSTDFVPYIELYNTDDEVEFIE